MEKYHGFIVKSVGCVVVTAVVFLKTLYSKDDDFEEKESMVDEFKLEKGLRYFYGVNKRLDIKKGIDILFSLESEYAIIMQQLLHKQYDELERRCLKILSESESKKHAYFILGWLCQEGNGRNQDLREAFNYYQRAVELGHPIACSKLAVMYENGIFVEKNLKKSIEYLEKAALMRHSQSMHKLALYLIEGNQEAEVTKDVEKGIFILKEACDLEYIKSYYMMALLLNEGLLVPQDKNLCKTYLQKAADQIPEASFLLLLQEIPATIKRIDLYNCNKIKEKFRDFFPLEILFELMRSCVHNNLNFTYQSLLEKAFINNDAESVYQIALIFENNPLIIIITPRLYALAARGGHSKSMYNYGHILLKGHDVKNAKKQFKNSSNLGFAPSMNTLSCLYEKEKKIAKAIHFAEMSSKSGCIQALYNLGYLYEKKGDLPDIEKAFDNYFASFQHKHEKALASLHRLILSRQIQWKKDYHILWPAKDENPSFFLIATVLMFVNRHRRIATYKLSRELLVKIIEHLSYSYL